MSSDLTKDYTVPEFRLAIDLMADGDANDYTSKFILVFDNVRPCQSCVGYVATVHSEMVDGSHIGHGLRPIHAVMQAIRAMRQACKKTSKKKL